MLRLPAGTQSVFWTNAKVDSNPKLGALTGNPAYFPLAAGGAAIDAGDNATCASAPMNNAPQNGVARPADGDADGTAPCGIGAYEYLGLSTPTPPAPPLRWATPAGGQAVGGAGAFLACGGCALAIPAGAVPGGSTTHLSLFELASRVLSALPATGAAASPIVGLAWAAGPVSRGQSTNPLPANVAPPSAEVAALAAAVFGANPPARIASAAIGVDSAVVPVG